MTDAKENSKAAFDQQAATYDRDVKGQHARALYPVILEKLSRIPYHTALDLGCGTGELMRRILEKDGSKVLYGLDLSEQMLETAKKKLGGKVDLVLGDSEHLPFEDASFDVVYCNDSFHHYPAPDEVLGEVFRVLKPGGTFLMCDSWHPGLGRVLINAWFRHSREGDVKLYSEREMRKLLSGHFSEIQWERVGSNACMAMGIKPPF
ncbi:MAG TPA: class I SAM-dependent methyltransferase [Candidatus Enterocloster faecavium]|uniref:Class I SAM-dependent methyltransferase n=1 Tax=Candidatus Enterocloster faecavium TaxID=2838560 RepID=A0A9D2L9H5_9FIRM|nr:class I SAM-dependent methyltransferase [Candidatus Enterocloster faecavium]